MNRWDGGGGCGGGCDTLPTPLSHPPTGGRFPPLTFTAVHPRAHARTHHHHTSLQVEERAMGYLSLSSPRLERNTTGVDERELRLRQGGGGDWRVGEQSVVRPAGAGRMPAAAPARTPTRYPSLCVCVCVFVCVCVCVWRARARALYHYAKFNDKW